MSTPQKRKRNHVVIRFLGKARFVSFTEKFEKGKDNPEEDLSAKVDEKPRTFNSKESEIEDKIAMLPKRRQTEEQDTSRKDMLMRGVEVKTHGQRNQTSTFVLRNRISGLPTRRCG